MSIKAHGQIRRSQAITTWGPGALLDLPRHSVIVGGLDFWPRMSDLDEINESRLARKISSITGIASPRLYAPPTDSDDPNKQKRGIGVWRFPEWFVVQEAESDEQGRSRRLVNRKALDDKGKFEGKNVVATRFVRACARGHVDDINWYVFVHGPDSKCRRPLWLDEKGTSGDLSELIVRCECGESRNLIDATRSDEKSLGHCSGRKPWLGKHVYEECNLKSRLLIRTAANAYFPQVMSVLSLPDRSSAVQSAVRDLWDDLNIVEKETELSFLKKKPKIKEKLDRFSDDEVLESIKNIKQGGARELPVKLVELEAILSVPEGYGDDVPIDPNFHARRLPERAWRKSVISENIENVFQIHRLREVLAMIGFTRLEAIAPDIHGEFESDVERAELADEPSWFPAVENRGEGIFIQLRKESVQDWFDRSPVKERIDQLEAGHKRWNENRNKERPFPGGPYILLHTLSHLLIQSLAMRCGYPASAIRERIYVDAETGRFGILLYTGSPDAQGTLGGLVQQARSIEIHLRQALLAGSLCSNDPICAQHSPNESMESRWLHGAACHGCTLVAETCCEMRNDYLDRALVVPTLTIDAAAFFGEISR